MKQKTRVRTWITTMALTTMGLITATAATTAGPAPRLDLRPVTPSDKTLYGLPSSTQVSGGLTAMGIGQPAYLDALVDIAIAQADILDVTWSLAEKPGGSAAVLQDSPLGASVPIYAPDLRATMQLAGRKLLRPDLGGTYVVEATVTTPAGQLHMSKKIAAATYMGLNTCTMCHSGSSLTGDKVGPWLDTHHADFFTRAIDGLASDHYGPNCVSCHVLGYDANTNAVNGGFDDVAAQLGYQIPSVFTNGNWAALPAKLKNLSNIQCENCHGPGSEHATAALVTGGFLLGEDRMIATTYAAGNCGQCHDALTHHKINGEWNNSRHAIATSYATGPSRAACVQCHSGMAFSEYASGASTLSTDYEPISCAACHDPHDAANPHQLRKVDSVTLANGMVVTNGGYGTLCMNCHMARRDGEPYLETVTAGSGSFGAHHGPQADMLMGVNGIWYGKTMPSSVHGKVVKESCVHCHMQTVAANTPGFTKTGGHTFTLGWDGGTPSDPSDDVHVTGACVECHGEVESFNFVRDDYDGNGVIEGVQDEVKGLLKQLAYLLPPYGPKDDITISSSWKDKNELKAAFNYRFVQEDGSFGVHNTAFAVALLKASIADLKDDADNDGMSDKWEIAQFGSITVCNGDDDTDNDGVKNSLEMAAGTNPMLADSDGDGINDLAEMQAGSDPLNAQDKPGFLVKIYNAAELQFASEIGKTYQLQKVSEITGMWQNYGEQITGTGEMISRLTSVRGDEQAYFRVVLVP